MKKDQQKPPSCKAPVKPLGPTPHMLALEPRYLFDAAALVTGLEVVDVAQAAGNTDLPDTTSQADSHEDLAGLFDHFVPADQRTAKEIIFVDPAVRDYNSLLQGVSGNAEVVLLDKGRDGVEQISEVLAGYEDVRAVHILSHGDDASLVLGGTVLNQGNIDTYQEALSGWQASLHADADILIYGCDVAAGEDGQAFVEQLAEFTGADIAASTDDTGAGGDWQLESTTGAVEADVPFDEVALAAYGDTLAVTVTDANDAPVANDDPGTPLFNGGFENGFTDWETIGNVSLQDASFGSGPTEGTWQAFLDTDDDLVDVDPTPMTILRTPNSRPSWDCHPVPWTHWPSVWIHWAM